MEVLCTIVSLGINMTGRTIEELITPIFRNNRDHAIVVDNVDYDKC